ncbi:cache domain-containing sensor histidine kinase [Cohnella candidum]|uniref:Sensor histidine kinase n=1 Tax=Cohnella candidum TaxID=2674991 RepID=A0A3G3JTJ7_9BACL|nr:sensor histidine kinase [Cohnella candidum]AYQ71532.1 sensor histidine kinase [Cohnella candidum]
MAGSMRKFATRFRFRKVRSRFFTTMILLSLPPLCLLGYISFDIARSTITQNNTQTNYDHLQTSSEVADLLFRNVVNLNRFIVLNDEIRNDLRESEVKSSEELSEMNTLTINRLQRVINSNSFDTRYVDSMCIFDLHYQTYCLGRSDDAGIYEIPGKKQAIESTDWYRRAFDAQGKVVFFSYNVLGDKADTFSTVKLFRDSAIGDGKPIGLLVTNLSKSMFGSVFNGSEENGRFLAIDSSGDPARILFPAKLPADLGIKPGSFQQIRDELESRGYLISEFRNQTTNWTFVHIIEEKQLLKQSNRIGTATALIAALLAFLALAISFVVSGSITRPLLQLKKMMVDWNKGSRDFGGVFREDEVGAIGETFKRMALENEELDARLFHSELKEREAELRALQAQIKPHFLYNTLDSIYWMARLKKTEEAAAMALALSESFKLSLNKGRETIPVYKELKHIEHYMTIQNIRYNGRFHYETDIDPSIMGIEMLKLILQPLVENAIYHGLEPKVGDGSIRIEGRRNGDFLEFAVEDDGVGMEDTARTEQGYGLRNVKERLTLYYGPSSSFTVYSKPGKGTRIEIRFKPFPEEVRQHA